MNILRALYLVINLTAVLADLTSTAKNLIQENDGFIKDSDMQVSLVKTYSCTGSGGKNNAYYVSFSAGVIPECNGVADEIIYLETKKEEHFTKYMKLKPLGLKLIASRYKEQRVCMVDLDVFHIRNFEWIEGKVFSEQDMWGDFPNSGIICGTGTLLSKAATEWSRELSWDKDVHDQDSWGRLTEKSDYIVKVGHDKIGYHAVSGHRGAKRDKTDLQTEGWYRTIRYGTRLSFWVILTVMSYLYLYFRRYGIYKTKYVYFTILTMRLMLSVWFISLLIFILLFTDLINSQYIVSDSLEVHKTVHTTESMYLISRPELQMWTSNGYTFVSFIGWNYIKFDKLINVKLMRALWVIINAMFRPVIEAGVMYVILSLVSLTIYKEDELSNFIAAAGAQTDCKGKVISRRDLYRKVRDKIDHLDTIPVNVTSKGCISSCYNNDNVKKSIVKGIYTVMFAPGEFKREVYFSSNDLEGVRIVKDQIRRGGVLNMVIQGVMEKVMEILDCGYEESLLMLNDMGSKIEISYKEACTFICGEYTGNYDLFQWIPKGTNKKKRKESVNERKEISQDLEVKIEREIVEEIQNSNAKEEVKKCFNGKPKRIKKKNINKSYINRGQVKKSDTKRRANDEEHECIVWEHVQFLYVDCKTTCLGEYKRIRSKRGNAILMKEASAEIKVFES